MILPRNFYIAILLSWVILPGCMVGKQARFSPDKKHAPAAVLQDLSAIENVLSKYHPSQYWYSDSLQVAEAFATGRRSVTDSMTEPAIRNLFNRVVSVLHCGHTSVRHSKDYSWYLMWKAPSGFPLGAKIVDDSTLIVASNLNRRDSVLIRGVRILSVNGRSSKTIIDSLFPLVPIDGFSRNFSHQLVSNNFIRFYNSVFPNDSIYRITYRDSLGRIDTVVRVYYNRRSDSVSQKEAFREAKKLIPPKKLTKKEMIRSFLIDTASKTAFLRLNTFSNDIKKRYIVRQFKELKKQQIPYLVIDLRNNGGGLISHSLLLARLIHKEKFKYVDSVITHTRKIKRLDKTAGRITKRFWINIALKLLDKKQIDGWNQFKIFTGKTYHPHRLNYGGKVYILTGGASFSATSMLLASLKGLPNVSLVGEETGGGQYGNNGIFIPDLVLPNTHLRMRLPLYRIINNHQLPNNGRGVFPDIEIRPDEVSIRRNQDVKMQKAEALIKADRENKK